MTSTPSSEDQQNMLNFREHVMVMLRELYPGRKFVAPAARADVILEEAIEFPLQDLAVKFHASNRTLAALRNLVEPRFRAVAPEKSLTFQSVKFTFVANFWCSENSCVGKWQTSHPEGIFFCEISGSEDSMDERAKLLADSVLPTTLRYFEWGAQTLSEFTDPQKLRPDRWFPATIRFLAGGIGFEIEYEQDYDDSLWTVYFQETMAPCKERFWPISFARCLR
jgi:hypothetical protein